MFLTRKPNARVKWPLEFLSLTICFFVYWRWTNSYLLGPFSYIYSNIYLYKNKYHCALHPHLLHTLFIQYQYRYQYTWFFKQIKWYDTDKPFRVTPPPFPHCSRMWCCAKLSLTTIKLLLYFNKYIFFSWYFYCIRGSLLSFMSWVFFYQELSRFIRQMWE